MVASMLDAALSIRSVGLVHWYPGQSSSCQVSVLFITVLVDDDYGVNLASCFIFRKYLPITPSLVVDQEVVPCTTAYLNVMAASAQEPDAIVCCPRREIPSSPAAHDHSWMTLETDICTSKVRE
jgi:hypothetical protein